MSKSGCRQSFLKSQLKSVETGFEKPVAQHYFFFFVGAQKSGDDPIRPGKSREARGAQQSQLRSTLSGLCRAVPPTQYLISYRALIVLPDWVTGCDLEQETLLTNQSSDLCYSAPTEGDTARL